LAKNSLRKDLNKWAYGNEFFPYSYISSGEILIYFAKNENQKLYRKKME
jgi:hypothetical protein